MMCYDFVQLLGKSELNILIIGWDMKSIILLICFVAFLLFSSLSWGTDYTGFWKVDCSDGFGIQIKLTENKLYTVSFCGPGGCFSPGCWMPNTRIEGDQKYKIISPNKLEIKRMDDGDFFTYVKCTNDPAWIVAKHDEPPIAEARKIPTEAVVCDDLNLRNEEKLLKKIANIITRKADNLFLKLENGKTISRTNVPCKKADIDLCKWGDFWDYRVYDYFKDCGFLLMEKHSYEYSEYELISVVDGSSLIIGGLPSFSHDKKRFIVNVNPIYDNFVSRLEIWKIDGSKFIKEFNYEPKEWPSVYTKWANDDNEIVIREARCIKDDAGNYKGYALDIIAKLKKKDTTWKLIHGN